MALPSIPPLAYWLPLPPLAGVGWLFSSAGLLACALALNVVEWHTPRQAPDGWQAWRVQPAAPTPGLLF
jgi:hypothetical protein